MQAVDSQLIVKTRLVCALEQSCTQSGVYRHGRMENPLGDRFMKHQVFTSVSTVSSVVESVDASAADGVSKQTERL